MKTSVEFNEAELISSMQEAVAHARGGLTLRRTKVPRGKIAISPAIRLANLPEALLRKRAAETGL